MNHAKCLALLNALFVVMTTSTSDLEIAQHQYSLHRLYQASELNSSFHFVIFRIKLTILFLKKIKGTNGTKYGSSHHTTNGATNTSNGMAHSQSTGDVTAIFGRA